VVEGPLSRKTSIGASSKVILIWLKSVPLVVDTVHNAICRQKQLNCFLGKRPEERDQKLLAEGTEQAEGGVNENVGPRRTTTGDDIC
jgi:hypothetical protein